MSVEFRQRTISDVMRMLGRRKWIIVLPILTMTIAVGYVVRQLPSIYESRALLTVQPPTISDIVVKPLTDDDLAQRIDTISKEVLSRTSLEQIIKKYDLYSQERNAGMPIELVVQRMTNKIEVYIDKTDNDRKLASFSITYRNMSPKAAQNVTSDLATAFINAQEKDKTQSVEQTRDFIENNLQSKKKVLDELERERLLIMTQNVETLPTSAQGLIAQLEGLRNREGSISKEKETLSMEKGRLNDNIQSLNSQISLNEEISEREVESARKSYKGVEQTPAYIQLIQKRAEANAKLENLKLTLRDANPKVVAAKNELREIENEIEKLKKSNVNDVAITVDDKRTSYIARKENLEIEKRNKVSQIAKIEEQMRSKDDELRQNAGNIAVLESKLNLIPNVQVALEGINTQYESAKVAYDDALKMKNEASLDFDRTNNAQGERINLQDRASLPQSPVAPKRQLLTAFGMFLGLAIGMFLAALLELPRVLKIQNIEDAKHYTGLPILASVPPLLTPQERVWHSRAYWLKVLGGFVLAIVSIPVVIFVLQLTRIFERAVS